MTNVNIFLLLNYLSQFHKLSYIKTVFFYIKTLLSFLINPLFFYTTNGLFGLMKLLWVNNRIQPIYEYICDLWKMKFTLCNSAFFDKSFSNWLFPLLIQIFLMCVMCFNVLYKIFNITSLLLLLCLLLKTKYI